MLSHHHVTTRTGDGGGPETRDPRTAPSRRPSETVGQPQSASRRAVLLNTLPHLSGRDCWQIAAESVRFGACSGTYILAPVPAPVVVAIAVVGPALIPE